MCKIIAFGCLIAVGLFLVSAQSHNYTWGYSGRNDTLLHREFIQQKSSWYGFARDELIFPKKGQTNNLTISYIRVTDQYVNGSGGFVYLTSGGVNYNSTTLGFKSQRRRGLRFIVEIFSNKTYPRSFDIPNPYYYLIKA